MASISVKLPLEIDSADGFVMNKDLMSTFRQNLKMLVLTSPGERVMSPDFGAGIRNFLFTNDIEALPALIEERIRRQVSIYMPAIQINQVLFDLNRIDSNQLGMQIVYSVPKIGIQDLLQITI